MAGLLTRLQQLRATEPHWTSKFVLRLAVVALDIIALGFAIACIVSALDPFYTKSSYDYSRDADYIAWSILSTTLSVGFCLLVILVPIFRNTIGSVHPGLAVVIDLLLSVAFLVTGPLAIAAVHEVATFRPDPHGEEGYRDSYSGHYVHAMNGTWVYKITYVPDYDDAFSGRHRTKASNRIITRDCSPQFDNCAQKDRFANAMYLAKSARQGPEIIVTIVQFINLILHFILLVLACLDVYRRHAGRKDKKSNGLGNGLMNSLVNSLTDALVRLLASRGVVVVNKHGSESAGLMSRAEKESHELESLDDDDDEPGERQEQYSRSVSEDVVRQGLSA